MYTRVWSYTYSPFDTKPAIPTNPAGIACGGTLSQRHRNQCSVPVHWSRWFSEIPTNPAGMACGIFGGTLPQRHRNQCTVCLLTNMLRAVHVDAQQKVKVLHPLPVYCPSTAVNCPSTHCLLPCLLPVHCLSTGLLPVAAYCLPTARLLSGILLVYWLSDFWISFSKLE